MAAFISYYPVRSPVGPRNRKAGACRSFRAGCIARGYSMALTQAALNRAGKQALAGMGSAIVWPH